jgi:lipid II:glycine glycyltransferase (peptidoglycan interpeptide bridge formation enzyme)
MSWSLFRRLTLILRESVEQDPKLKKNELRVEVSDITQVDKDRWDSFINMSSQAHYAQSTSWARYRNASGWKPYFVSVLSSGVLVGVCLALHKSVGRLSKGGVVYVSRGPVLNHGVDDSERVVETLVDAVKKLTLRRLAVLRISPDYFVSESWIRNLLKSRGFSLASKSVQHTSTMRIDIRQSPEELISLMRRSRRFEVRKYERERPLAWTVSFDRSQNSLQEFYSMYVETLERQGNSYKSLEALCLMEQYRGPKELSVAIMRYEGRPVAGAIVLGQGRRLWYLYGGSVKGDKLIGRSGVYLQWEIIKWAMEEGFEEYDLHGIPLKSEPGDKFHGVYTFKKGFGGSVVELIGEFNYSPIPMLDHLLEGYLERL